MVRPGGCAAAGRRVHVLEALERRREDATARGVEGARAAVLLEEQQGSDDELLLLGGDAPTRRIARGPYSTRPTLSVIVNTTALPDWGQRAAALGAPVPPSWGGGPARAWSRCLPGRRDLCFDFSTEPKRVSRWCRRLCRCPHARRSARS